MRPSVAFRPHHFLCSLGYKGLGYSPKFVANYNNIIKIIRADENTPIQVVVGFDNICKSCPNQEAKTNKCVFENKIAQLDQAHLSILGLSPDENITWGEAKNRIKNNFSLENFHKACEPCEWKKLGICEEALLALKK